MGRYATDDELYPIAQEALQRSIADMANPHPNTNSTSADRARTADKMATTAARLNPRNR